MKRILKGLSLLCALALLSGPVFAAETSQAKSAKPAAAAPKAKPAATATPAKPDSNLLSGWNDKWPDGKPTGASLTGAGNQVTITGNSMQNSYGSVYRVMNVDLDKTPFLVVDVASVNGFWYLIAKNANIKYGYVKVQPDTNTNGKQVYDLKGITALDGKRDLEIELGISSGKEQANSGKAVTIKEIRFTEKESGALPGALSQGPWKDKWPDGKSTDATFKEEGNLLVVSGSSKEQYYGSIYRILSVNLDKTPILRITPAKVAGSWYIEASGGSLKAPVKIQPDTDSAETKTYDLRTALGLSGEQHFELHLGITSGGKEPNQGKEVSFNKDMSFTAASGQ